MHDLKLTYNCEPFQYVADMHKIMQAIKSLGLKMEDVMQYFIWDESKFKNSLNLNYSKFASEFS